MAKPTVLVTGLGTLRGKVCLLLVVLTHVVLNGGMVAYVATNIGPFAAIITAVVLAIGAITSFAYIGENVIGPMSCEKS